MLHIYTSTVGDGTMKTIDGDSETARQNRCSFAEKSDINPADTTLHTLGYDTTDFCRYTKLEIADKGDGMLRESTINADAVVVTQPGHAVLLPLADCVGAVIHDIAQNILMVSHLGRHSLEQHGGSKSIKHLVETYGSNPISLKVWLSPAAGRGNYPLEAFEGRSLQEVAMNQIMNMGISPDNIQLSPIDTTLDPTYYSHSEFLKGHRDTDGRFCILAMTTSE